MFEFNNKHKQNKKRLFGQIKLNYFNCIHILFIKKFIPFFLLHLFKYYETIKREIINNLDIECLFNRLNSF
jgi:hypothetical protein